MAEGPQIVTKISSRERIVVFLLVISVVINYVDRSNLSLAVPLIQRQFALLPLQIGSLLSAFFWTYALLQISGIAGWLSDRFPVGWVMVGGYVLWSGATVVTGLVSGFSALYIHCCRTCCSSTRERPNRCTIPTLKVSFENWRKPPTLTGSPQRPTVWPRSSGECGETCCARCRWMRLP